MKRKRMAPDIERAFALASGFARHGAAFVAIDPGASTGWAMSCAYDLIESGQDAPADAARAVLDTLGDRPIALLAVEEPFLVGRGAQWRLPWAAGEVRGRLAAHQVDESCLWTPKPVVWRAVLGFARGRRDDVNAAIHAWAEDRVRAPLRRPGGAPEADRANAIALLSASLAVCATVVAGRQHGGSNGDREHVRGSEGPLSDRKRHVRKGEAEECERQRGGGQETQTVD
jgi:hypothetical protein